jgi:prepilin-type N-terminal cleavage/methylation domain-containing protein
VQRRNHNTGAAHGKRTTPRCTRHGFTLIEVMVAVAIGGLVLLGARSLLEVLADEEHHIARDTATEDARSNGYRTLRSLVGQMEVGTTESGPFSGDPESTSFTTWCDTPSGWQERCAVTLAFEHEGREPVLLAHLPGERRLVLARDFSVGEFRYLNSATSGGQWFRQWGRGITAPLAIGIILERGTTSDIAAGKGSDGASHTIGRWTIDTLIVRIGERG